MFIVKAVKADDSYELFSGEGVRVTHSQCAGQNAPGQPPYIAPDFDIYIGGEEIPGKFIHVGNGADHYAHVYVMNERGKTVDTVSWLYNEAIAPPLGRQDYVARTQRAG